MLEPSFSGSRCILYTVQHPIIFFTLCFCCPVYPMGATQIFHLSTLTEPLKNELALGMLIFGKPPLSLFKGFGGVLGGVAETFSI